MSDDLLAVTVYLDEQGEAEVNNLVTHGLAVDRPAALRRALHLADELLQHQQDGGTILLVKGRTRERLRFT